MHYGRFCRETGRWIKVEADQAPPVSPVLPINPVTPVGPELAQSETPREDNLVPLADKIARVTGAR